MRKIILSLLLSYSAISHACDDMATKKIDIIENKDGSVTQTVTTHGGKLDSFTRTSFEAYGETELSNGTITRDLLMSGNLAFHNLEVRGNSVIKGDFHGKHGRFRALTITGKVDVKDVDVLGKFEATGNRIKFGNSRLHNIVEIKGKLTAENSRFSRNLTVTGPKIKLRNSVVDKNLKIKHDNKHHNKKDHHESEVELLYVDRDSHINGNIEFESGNGVVIDESGKIRAVQIKGGELRPRTK